MPSSRRNGRTATDIGRIAEEAGAADRHDRAAEALRSLRNKIVHLSVSDPADESRTAYVEFDLPLSEPIISLFSIVLASEKERDVKMTELRERVGRTPSDKVLAALQELEQAGPWFETKEDLFRALEAHDEE